MGLILDTNFIVTAEREARRGAATADAFLATHAQDDFYITFTIAGELACGQSASARTVWKRLIQPFSILPWSLDVSWQYGEIYRQLQTAGSLIGGNDLWIAAAALVHGFPVVTRNVDEFQRVPGLTVLSF
jgi:tRNA(fMet)-specific endonuclease VapC